MGKVCILLVALVVEAAGVALLSRGLRQIDAGGQLTVAAVVEAAAQLVSNRDVLLGLLLEAVFFAILLFLLSRHEMSVIWPLTSVGFVISTLVAKFYLHEEVSALRWSGVVLIAIGATMVSASENAHPVPSEVREP